MSFFLSFCLGGVVERALLTGSLGWWLGGSVGGGWWRRGRGLEQYVLILKRFFWGGDRGVKGGQRVEEQRQSWIHKITPSSPSASSGSVAAISTAWGVSGGGGRCF